MSVYILSSNISGMWILALAADVVFIVMLFMYLITYKKNVCFTAYGVTVSFWFWNAFYSWSDLKTVRYVDYTNRINWVSIFIWSVLIYEKTFEISPKEVRKNITSANRYQMFHPWTFIPVYLSPKPINTQNARAYIIEEAVLKQKLAEWGVEVEVLR